MTYTIVTVHAVHSIRSGMKMVLSLVYFHRPFAKPLQLDLYRNPNIRPNMTINVVQLHSQPTTRHPQQFKTTIPGFDIVRFLHRPFSSHQNPSLLPPLSLLHMCSTHKLCPSTPYLSSHYLVPSCRLHTEKRSTPTRTCHLHLDVLCSSF